MTQAADPGVTAGKGRRLESALVPLIGRVRRLTRRQPVLLGAAVLVVGGGGAAAAVAVSASSSPVPAAVLADCGSGVSGQGFRVFACMSGGAAAGYPHPKELLVVRSDGSSVAYPAFRVGGLAAGDGQVVATYDAGLVRVTSSRLVPLLTERELARALHLRPAAFHVMDVYDLRVDARGDVYFVASISRSGRECRNPLLERTAGGALRRIPSSTSRHDICH